MTTGKWSVVAIVKEPQAVLERFVAWYLHQGADRILLYFDDPNDPGIAQMARHAPRVQCTPCTRAFWEKLGVADAPNFTRRQNAAMMHGYARIPEGWVGVVDADELFLPVSGTLSDLLETLPASDRSVLIKPAEYVFFENDPDLTLFRRPMNARQVSRVYGEFADHMAGNKGLIGHLVGKSFTRAGLEVARAHPHWFCDADGNRIVDAIRNVEDGYVMLHFYFLNYADWRRKMEYRVHALPRGRRDKLLDKLARLLDRGAERGLRQIWRNMHGLSVTQKTMLEKRDLLLAPELGLSKVTARHFVPERAAGATRTDRAA
jgi:hypothetical protein